MAGAQTIAPARPPASRQPDESSRRSRVQAARTNQPAVPLADWARRQSQTAGPRVSLAPARAPAPQPAESVELAGSATFAPSPAVAEYLKGRRKGTVNVRLGTLAAGAIEVRRSKDRYDTVGDGQAIALVHPALDPLLNAGLLPVLAVAVRNNVVTGYVTVGRGTTSRPGPPEAIINAIGEKYGALGWQAMGRPTLRRQANQLQAGVLTLATDVNFTLGGFLKGSGRFALVDEQVTFAAQATASVGGLAKVALDVSRAPDGTLTGRTEVPVAYRNFSGRVVAQLAGGVVDVMGTASYKTEKLSGDVTLQLTDAATAREVSKRLLPPSAIQAEAAQAAGATPGAPAPAPAGPRPGPRAVIGWGALNFEFNKWLTGTATVIVDGAGNVTVVGRIAPPAAVPLFKTAARPRFFDVNPRFGFGVPYVARAFVGATIWLGAIASIDANLNRIEVEGVYSTDPAIFNSFSLAGTLTVDALAGLEGGVGIEGGLELLGHEVTVGAGIDLAAGLIGHLEARPTIAYRELADPQAGRRGEFSIAGYVEVAAQPFLALAGRAWIKLDSPWWSPAPDKTWPKDLGQREYMLGGPFGYGLDFAYVLGSGKSPELKPRKPGFDGRALASDLMDDNIPTGSQSKRKVPATWKEKTPPAPPAPAPPSPARGPAQGRPEHKPLAPSPQDRLRWTATMEDIRRLAGAGEKRPYGEAELLRMLAAIRNRHALARLEAKANGSVWDVYARLGTTTNDSKPAKVPRASAEPAGAPGAIGPQLPPERPARDLRDRAGEMVAQRASGEHSARDVDQVVAAVREELRPKGLARLEFEAPNAEGESFLVAQASKAKRVGKKRKPPALTTRTVVLRAILEFHDVKDARRALPSRFDEVRVPKPRTGSVGAGAVGVQPGAHVGYVPAGQGAQGAVMLKPDADAKRIEIVAWNSGFPVPGTVSSHAESFFLDWLRHARLRGLAAMHVQINLSPCTHCARNLAGEVPAGAVGTLQYSVPYEGRDRRRGGILYENSTTLEDLRQLAPGWSVHPTSPAPRWTDASKREEIRAGTVIYEGRP